MIARVTVAVALTLSLTNPADQAPAQSGAATIAGVVVSTDAAPKPVRRAIVTVTGGNIANNLSAVADDEGRFRFQDLAPGRYTVSVAKAAYLSIAYGAARPGRPGTPIVVTAGQQVNIRVALPHGAVITGTVRDQFGQPMSGMQISVSTAESTQSASGFRPLSDAILTDDRGQYRAYGLMPGEYVVWTAPRLSGGGEIFRMTQTEFDAKIRALEQRYGASPTAAQAATPAAARDTSSLPSGDAAPLGYAPTFYPGTTIAADAARIRVAAGEERGGVDIAFIPVRAARISGIVQGGEIPPTRIMPSLTVIGPSDSLGGRPVSGPLADGSFTFTNVTPGRYTLMVRTGNGAMMRTADGRGGSSTNPGMAAMFATMDLNVNGSDIGGLVLLLRPAVSIAGRVTFEASTLKPPTALTGIDVGVVAAGPSVTTVANSLPLIGLDAPPSTRLLADGTFKLEGIVPGTYSLSSSVAGGWWLRSAVANGHDLLDDPVQVDGSFSEITDVVLTFSDRRSGVQGTLTAASGQPASEFIVIAYPVDRAYWKPGARRVKTTRPGSDGAFNLNDLPAGEYYLAALTDAEPNEWQQAAFLEQLVSASVKVTIAEGQKARQDLRIAR